MWWEFAFGELEAGDVSVAEHRKITDPLAKSFVKHAEVRPYLKPRASE